MGGRREPAAAATDESISSYLTFDDGVSGLADAGRERVGDRLDIQAHLTLVEFALLGEQAPA